MDDTPLTEADFVPPGSKNGTVIHSRDNIEGKLTEIVSLQQFLKAYPLKAFAWIIFLTLATIAPVWRQGLLNPFDLTPRLPSSETEPPAWNTGNPFDVAHAINPVTAASVQSAQKAKAKPAKPPRPRLTTQEQYKTFLFAITVANLALLTLLITIFRSVYQKAYRGFLNENMLNQIHREAQSSGALAYYILYVMFVLNAGTFVPHRPAFWRCIPLGTLAKLVDVPCRNHCIGVGETRGADVHWRCFSGG